MTRVWPELTRKRSGLWDGPLSVRVRPSSLKHDCRPQDDEHKRNCLVNVHAKSCLTLALRTLRSETRARREPARTGRGPSSARCGQARGRQLPGATADGVPDRPVNAGNWRRPQQGKPAVEQVFAWAPGFGA